MVHGADHPLLHAPQDQNALLSTMGLTAAARSEPSSFPFWHAAAATLGQSTVNARPTSTTSVPSPLLAASAGYQLHVRDGLRVDGVSSSERGVHQVRTCTHVRRQGAQH